MIKKIFSIVSTVLMFLVFLSSLTVKAIDLQGSYSTNGYSSTTGSGIDTLVGLIFLALICIFFVFIIASTVIWALSIIDIVQRDNWKNENDKILWLLVILLFNLYVVSIYYYFFYRKKLDREAQAVVETPTT